jgi:hypothetical protein
MSQNGDTTPKLDWAALLFRPLLISGMTTCIAASWIMLLETALGNWRGDYIVGLAALMTLETLIAERQMRMRGQFHSDRLLVRLTELGVMLVVLKLASYLHRGWAALANDIQMLPYQPLSFFDMHFIIGAILIIALWLLALNIAALLAELESPGAGPQDREAARNELKNCFGIGAVILLLPIGLQGLDRTWPALSIHIALVNSLTVLPLLYFGLGLALFGQARLALLQTSWAADGIPVAPGLARRWATWGMILIGAVIVLALLMPAGSTMVGVYAFTWLLWLIATIGQWIAFVFVFLLGLLLSPCMLLFRLQQPENLRPLQPLIQPPPSPPVEGRTLLPIQIVAFWVAVAIAIYLILRAYWHNRQTSGLWKTLAEVLREWWRGLVAWLRGWRGRVHMPKRRRAAKKPVQVTTTPSWWQRWQARTPQERVRRFYLALLDRAAQAGLARHPDQTPYEYASRLKPHLSEEEDALSTLTQAFVEARYSRRTFEPKEVSLIQRLWQRLREKLRKR